MSPIWLTAGRESSGSVKGHVIMGLTRYGVTITSSPPVDDLWKVFFAKIGIGSCTMREA